MTMATCLHLLLKEIVGLLIFFRDLLPALFGVEKDECKKKIEPSFFRPLK